MIQSTWCLLSQNISVHTYSFAGYNIFNTLLVQNCAIMVIWNSAEYELNNLTKKTHHDLFDRWYIKSIEGCDLSKSRYVPGNCLNSFWNAALAPASMRMSAWLCSSSLETMSSCPFFKTFPKGIGSYAASQPCLSLFSTTHPKRQQEKEKQRLVQYRNKEYTDTNNENVGIIKCQKEDLQHSSNHMEKAWNAEEENTWSTLSLPGIWQRRYPIKSHRIACCVGCNHQGIDSELDNFGAAKSIVVNCFK